MRSIDHRLGVFDYGPKLAAPENVWNRRTYDRSALLEHELGIPQYEA